MSFGLKPKDYLNMLLAAQVDLQKDPLSVRRLIECCFLGNHLPESVFWEYETTAPSKLHGKTTCKVYRSYIEGLCAEACIVRDLCDFAKHVRLHRRTVQVKSTTIRRVFLKNFGWPLPWMMMPRGMPTTRFVVELESGRELYAGVVVNTLVSFWSKQFDLDDL